MNIATLFRCNSELPVIIDGLTKVAWSSNKLYSDAAGIAANLQRSGIMPGDHIIMVAGNCAETFAFSLAVFSIGAVAVPLNPGIGQHALADIARKIAPVCCFHDVRLGEELTRALSPSCRISICIHRSALFLDRELVYYDSLVHESCQLTFRDFPADHPALLMHTSGSQGRPKAIRYSHQDLFNYFHFHDLIHRQYADSRSSGAPNAPLVSVFHPSHLASYSLVFQGMLMQRPTLLMQSFQARDYLTLVADYRCRISLLVPSMYELLIKEANSSCWDFSCWEIACAVGEKTPETLASKVEETFGVTVFSCYGLTECLPGFAHSWEDLNNRYTKRGSSGKCLFEELRLVDSEGRESNPGELHVRNATVRRCYVDDRFNQEKFTSDGWLKTGDLFLVDEDGYFFHQGRVDDMFVANGKNIYPSEIEFVLLKHPKVERVVASSVTNRIGKSMPAVLIQSQESLDHNDILNFFVKVGPLYAVPKYIKTVATLPEVGPGKLNRNECRKILQIGFESSVA